LPTTIHIKGKDFTDLRMEQFPIYQQTH